MTCPGLPDVALFFDLATSERESMLNAKRKLRRVAAYLFAFAVTSISSYAVTSTQSDVTIRRGHHSEGRVEPEHPPTWHYLLEPTPPPIELKRSVYFCLIPVYWDYRDVDLSTVDWLDFGISSRLRVGVYYPRLDPQRVADQEHLSHLRFMTAIIGGTILLAGGTLVVRLLPMRWVYFIHPPGSRTP